MKYKKCPFCGGDAHEFTEPETRFTRVECANQVYCPLWQNFSPEQWNTRATCETK